jgi:hypothetical protein
MIEQQEILDELQKTFPIQVGENISKASILFQLEIRLSELLQQNAETFFQLMYRLDISERKLTAALEDKTDTIADLALLIYDRQVEKITSRRQNRPPDPSADKDLTW